MDNSIQIQQLINARSLSTNEEYLSFESALQSLQKNITIDDVPEICKAFCDDTQNDEVMFEIIHLIEQLQGDEYLKKIAICSPNMKDAHDWAMTLNKRIINSQRFFEKYIEVISELEEESKEKIILLLNDVKNDNPKRFAEKIDMLYERVKRQHYLPVSHRSVKMNAVNFIDYCIHFLFQGKYGADNVHWNINSVGDILRDPTRLKGYTVEELQNVLGSDWTRGVYESNGGGWKLMNGDISIFYHPGRGKHGGSYYGISSGATGKIKVVNPETYIPLKGDKATIIYD